MIRDTFMEVLVESKAAPYIRVLRDFLYVLTALFVIAFVFSGLFIAMIIEVVFGVLAYFIGLRTKIEYEYDYMNKELDVDIIYDKQKRKHLATYDLSKMEVLAPVNSYHLDDYKNRNYKVCDYSSKIEMNKSKQYVMYYSGEAKIIFEPTSEMIEAFTYIAPRKVFRD